MAWGTVSSFSDLRKCRVLGREPTQLHLPRKDVAFYVGTGRACVRGSVRFDHYTFHYQSHVSAMCSVGSPRISVQCLALGSMKQSMALAVEDRDDQVAKG